MADPYTVLGVRRDAAPEDIRSAYRKLAKLNHPDLHPGNKDAERRFKEITAAYDILGDKEKRARFDRGEIDESGAERPQYRYQHPFGEGGPNFGFAGSGGSFRDLSELDEILNEMMGRHTRTGAGSGGFGTRASGAQYILEISFEDAVNGATKRISLPESRTLDVTIPAGIEDGTTLRLRGQQRRSGAMGSGDILVEIRVSPDPRFQRKGMDIHSVLPVTLAEALAGGKVPVETVTGTVQMTIPPGSSTGTLLRVKGKGVLDAKTQNRGDQIVRLEVVLPEKPDASLQEFIRAWERDHPYDPRRRES